MSVEQSFLIVHEYRCPLCGVKLDFFHRKYEESSIGARHPRRKGCPRSGKAYYVPHAQLAVMEKDFQ